MRAWLILASDAIGRCVSGLTMLLMQLANSPTLQQAGGYSRHLGH